MNYLYSIVFLLVSTRISFLIGRYICQNESRKSTFSKIIKKLFSSEFLLSVMAIIISIVGVYISYQQTQIAKQEKIIYEQEVYPHFNVYTSLDEEKINDRYAHKHLYIYNNGGNFYQISCSVIAFLKVEYDIDTYYVPTNSFFGISQQIVSDDNLVYKFTGFKNNLKRSSLNRKLHEYANNNDKIIGSVFEKIFLKIYYQDIFGEYHTSYFNGNTGELLNTDYGEKLFKKHNKRLKEISYEHFSSYNIDDLIKYINTHEPDNEGL